MDFSKIYKPVQERTADNQYQSLLKEVLKEGVMSKTQQGPAAMTKIGPSSMHFKFENGFPIINERNMAPKESERLPVTIWRQAIGEILGFINGARTQKELLEFGCSWWEPWVTEAKCKKRGLETGDIGPGSYGAAFHDFPTSEGESFNQYKHIVEQIKELPHLRTHFVSPWIPQYIGRGKGKQQKVTVAPCHGWVHIRVIDNKLTLHMIQRSGDLPIGVPSNMVQYAALALALAQVTDTEPYEYVHSLSDAHIYEDQVEAVEKMLTREPKKLATVKLDDSIDNLFDFRHHHFSLEDYEPYPGIKGIPVAI